jgi:hypothetical protein
MASSLFSYGYLESGYLLYSYGGQTEGLATLSQVQMVIADNEKKIRTQAKINVQDAEKPVRSQAQRQIVDAEKTVFSQGTLVIGDVEKNIGTQIDRFLGDTKEVQTQVDRAIQATSKSINEQVKFGNVVHNQCDDAGYLAIDYLTVPYLTTFICAHLRSQVVRQTTHENEVRTQVRRIINTEKHLRTQAQRKIQDIVKSTQTQVDRIGRSAVKTQVRKALYNTTNLRILWEFPSRGDGTNWTSNSTAAGDYDPNNLNTDIVEQIWKSNSAVAGVYLTCDAGSPVFVDTLAILNHNFTTSATVLFQGSNDPGFSTTGIQIDLNPTAENIYYIAPTLPTSSFRYWRISVDDNTNTAGFLTMGTVVFGSATIFQGECFVDRVMRSSTHYSDKIATEGFTNVANDRALKNATSLEFRSLRFNRGNYNNIREIFEEMRTSLKALWIPTPQYPSRFAVFGKLRDIPQETHNVKGEDLDFVDFQIEVDESL